ncbi:amidase [Pseudomonas syringae]|uniref:Amidase n=1 Tax=Pseudomonas syringae pv. aceris TaxID=199198 RepID=A0A0P9GVE2_PSESX|nr:amidase [Pseudomonas syringae]EGH71519.1 Amidase [Pseudomonas syringae pv. aceris str. M302273]KPW09185.1 Amidase [Pseudomonas syringae pv. aceris]
MHDNAIVGKSLVDVAQAIAVGELTSVQVLEACLTRFERVAPLLNASLWIDQEAAYAAAYAADSALQRGERVGVLHGVPLAHKDMFAQANRKCSFGSKVYSDLTHSHDATVIARLAGAGAYAFAGLNMAEFAQNGTGHNAHFGDGRNAWDSRFISGGSSSGSGASVAACITYGSLGSDTGGSVRLPASANGVTGIKPTHSRVSRYGVMPLSFSTDTVGPLARTARDCARMLGVIAGFDPHDHSSARVAVDRYEQRLNGDITGLRIGVPRNYFFKDASDCVISAFEKALDVLESRGAILVRLELPLMDAINTYGGLVTRVEAASLHVENMRKQAGSISRHTNSRLFVSLAIPAAYYVEAISRRGSVLKQFATEVFEQVDVLATPTIAFNLPTRADSDIDAGGEGADYYPRRVSDNTRPFNYLGLPSISFPCGFDFNGLPIGIQIAGRPFAESTILNVADAFQRDTDWHLKRPVVDNFAD